MFHLVDAKGSDSDTAIHESKRIVTCRQSREDNTADGIFKVWVYLLTPHEVLCI